MSEYTTIEHYVNHVMGEITKRDVEQVSERLRALGWEEVVRCRDCAYICNREYANGLKYNTCSYFDSEYAEVEPDGFCAWGELR